MLAAADHLDADAPVLVLNGDVPLVTGAALRALVEDHAASGAAATLATMMLEDPTGYGRIVRDAGGAVERVVETKRAGRRDRARSWRSTRSTRASTSSTGARCSTRCGRVGTDNAQGEIYLPDALAILRADGAQVAAHAVDDPALLLGVNDRVELARVRALAQRGSRRRTCAPG